MKRHTLLLTLTVVLLLHVGLFVLLSRSGLPQRPPTPRGPHHFDHIAVRVYDDAGESYIVRQYTVSTDLADPTPQFVGERKRPAWMQPDL